MPITTLDGVIAGMRPPATIVKAATPTMAAGRPHSLFYLAGMPGAAVLGDQRLGLAVFMDQPMGADLGGGIAKAGAGRGPVRHAGVMQDDQFGALPAPVAMIGRKAQSPPELRSGRGSQPQTKPSPSGSSPLRSFSGPPESRKADCA